MKIDTNNVNKTIFVEKVKLTEIYNSSIKLPSIDNPDFLRAITVGEEPTQIEVKREIVHADEYTTPDGKHFRIGLSEQVRNALGIPLEAWKDMQHENERLRNNIEVCRAENHKYRKFIFYCAGLSFWGRVKLIWQGFKLNKRMEISTKELRHYPIVLSKEDINLIEKYINLHGMDMRELLKLITTISMRTRWIGVKKKNAEKIR